MILDRLDIDANAFHGGTGWEIKPEGACKGDVCVPLAPTQGFDVAAVARPPRHGARARRRAGAVGARARRRCGGRALVTAEAPELVLDDLDGNEFHLSSLRGQKVLLVAWAPY